MVYEGAITENIKGNQQVKLAASLLQQAQGLNYIGFVEGDGLYRGEADVVVCDGFVGNVVLKFAEGLVGVVTQLVREGIKDGGILAKLGALLMLPVFKKIKHRLDHTENGGAPLLGVNGVFLISHGSSKAKEIFTAIKIAGNLVDNKIIENIQHSIEEEGAIKYDDVD